MNKGQSKPYMYALTSKGKERVEKNLFFLQQTSCCKGYTKYVLHALYNSKLPLTIKGIQDAIEEINGINLKGQSISGIMKPCLQKKEIEKITPA